MKNVLIFPHDINTQWRVFKYITYYTIFMSFALAVDDIPVIFKNNLSWRKGTYA